MRIGEGDVLRFHLGEYEVPAEITSASVSPSLHTGAQLYVLGARVRARGALGEQLSELIGRHAGKESEGVTAHRNGEDTGRKWKLQIRSTSYSGSPAPDTLSTFVLEIQEAERLVPDALVIDDLELVPYRYEERASEGYGLDIDTRVRVNEEQRARLMGLIRRSLEGGDYLPVIRRGISEEPRRMRFGQTLWSKDGDEFKYDLILVEQSEQDRKRLGLLPDHSQMRTVLAHYAVVTEGLLALLTEKGTLSAAEATRLRDDATAQLFERQHRFFAVDDIDEYE